MGKWKNWAERSGAESEQNRSGTGKEAPIWPGLFNGPSDRSGRG